MGSSWPLLPALSSPQDSEVLGRLIRAVELFNTVAPLIGKLVHNHPDLIGAAIQSMVLAGPAARSVQAHLLVAITPSMLDADQTARLIDLLEATQLHQVQAALQACAVHHARHALALLAMQLWEEVRQIVRVFLAIW